MPRFPDFYPFFPVLRVLAGTLPGSLFFLRRITERIFGYVRFIVVDSAICKKIVQTLAAIAHWKNTPESELPGWFCTTIVRAMFRAIAHFFRAVM